MLDKALEINRVGYGLGPNIKSNLEMHVWLDRARHSRQTRGMDSPKLDQTAFGVALQALAISRAQLRVLMQKNIITHDEFRQELDQTILRLRDVFARTDDRLGLALTEAALADLLSEV